jgi:hypothetical protein
MALFIEFSLFAFCYRGCHPLIHIGNRRVRMNERRNKFPKATLPESLVTEFLLGTKKSTADAVLSLSVSY